MTFLIFNIRLLKITTFINTLSKLKILFFYSICSLNFRVINKLTFKEKLIHLSLSNSS